MQHRRPAALAIAIGLLPAPPASAVTPSTHTDQISPSYTMLYTPPQSPDATTVQLDAPLGTSLRMTLAVGGRCGTSAPVRLRSAGRRGRLEYP